MKTITPFSNGTEFMIWQHQNCDECNKYENKSTERSKAGCRLIFDIELAAATDGKIPLTTAKWIGYKDGHLTNCKMKNIPFGVAKFNSGLMNQLTIKF